MNTTHTPIPWQRHPAAPGLMIVSNYHEDENDATYSHIADFNDDFRGLQSGTPEGNFAFALLAVNAHDALVEALQICLDHLVHTDATHDRTGRRVDFSAVTICARAALALAEKES